MASFLMGNKGPKTLVLDIDGTMTPIDIPTPDRRIEPVVETSLEMYNSACQKQSDIYPFFVIIATGRDENQIKQCYGGKMPPYPAISSNGAQLYIPGKDPIIHAFKDAELEILQNIKSEVSCFAQCNPQLYIETTKPFEVGFHFKPNIGYEDVSQTEINFLGSDLLAIMNKYLIRAEKLGLPFRIEETEVTHRCFNHASINKISGFHEFAEHLGHNPRSKDMSQFVYFGDCFYRGNDRDTASYIRKHHGTLVQVYNDHKLNIPDEGDDAEPHVALPSCRELGQVLRKWVRPLIQITH